MSNKTTVLIIFNAFLLLFEFFPIPFLFTPIVIILAILGNSSILGFYAFKNWKDSITLPSTSDVGTTLVSGLETVTEQTIKTGVNAATTYGPTLVIDMVKWIFNNITDIIGDITSSIIGGIGDAIANIF